MDMLTAPASTTITLKLVMWLNGHSGGLRTGQCRSLSLSLSLAFRVRERVYVCVCVCMRVCTRSHLRVYMSVCASCHVCGQVENEQGVPIAPRQRSRLGERAMFVNTCFVDRTPAY